MQIKRITVINEDGRGEQQAGSVNSNNFRTVRFF